jgi:hypothetical protein
VVVDQVWRSASAYDGGVVIVRRILLALAAVVGVMTWLWFSAVRAVPGVRGRKEQARAARRGSQADA